MEVVFNIYKYADMYINMFEIYYSLDLDGIIILFAIISAAEASTSQKILKNNEDVSAAQRVILVESRLSYDSNEHQRIKKEERRKE